VESAADATLEVTITEFSQEIASTHRRDSAIADTHRLVSTAKCTLRDNRGGGVYFSDVPVDAPLNLRGGCNFSDARYQAIPALARDLAIQIRHLVTAAQ
jgi:hypothetical protein